jgi:hypothetical protein
MAALSGTKGFQAGHYERWLGVEGPWTLDLPNGPGGDGRENIRRFLQRTDPLFQPGDEWIEIRRDGMATHLFTGALLNVPSATLGHLTVGGYDAMWLMKLIRETEAGFWNHSPRDVLEHYTRCWNYDFATGFPEAGAAVLTGAAGPVRTGHFDYSYAQTNMGLPVCRLLPQAIGTLSSIVTSPGLGPPSVGYLSGDPYTPWRAEMSCYVSAKFPVNGNVLLGASGFAVQVIGVTTTASGLIARLYDGSGGTIDAPVPGTIDLLPGQLDITMEGRERWVFCYVNGTLVGVIPMPTAHAAPNAIVYDAEGGTATVDIQSFTYERGLPWLMRGSDKGDYVLPGLPPPGGLQSQYFDDADLTGVSQPYDKALSPVRTPYASRTDAYFTQGRTAWQPAGAAGGWSMRSTGSVFLDLANYDFRVQIASDSPVRLWMGKTRMGEQVIDLWPAVGAVVGSVGGTATTAYLRSVLGSVSGWYPLRLEFAALGGAPAAGLVLQLERSDVPGTFFVAPTVDFSPFGCYNNQVRHDSHYDTFLAVANTFGYQFTCEPYSLESGLFPGQVIPRVRVGRDRNAKISDTDSTDLQLTSSGEDLAARIVGDAAGIADPNGSSQLSAVAVDFTRATGHMFCATAVESLSDITDPQLLAQRLRTLLALRSGPWDQIASRPPGHPELVSDWPVPVLPVLPTKFAWEPGDGVLRSYPRLGTVDTQPQQLSSLLWDFHPDAIAAPQANFRPYPRGVYWTLRKQALARTATERTYQGQGAERNGTVGGVTGTIAASPTAAALDSYSRISTRGVTKVWLDVTRKLGTVAWSIEINGIATAITVASPGRYDVSTYLSAQAVTTDQYMIARLTTAVAPFDSVEFALNAQVPVS